MDLSNLYSIFSILTCSRENSRTLWYPGINIHATNSFCQVVQECEKFMNNSRPTRQSGYLIRMKGLISLRAKAFNLPTLSCLNCVYWFWNKLIAWLAFRNNGKSWLGNKANRLKQRAHRSTILSAIDLCHFPSKYHWDSVPGGAGETHTVAPVRLCINTCLARSAFVCHADTSGKTQWGKAGGKRMELFQPDKVSDMLAFIYFFWRAGGLALQTENPNPNSSYELSNFARSAAVEMFIKMQLNFCPDAWRAAAPVAFEFQLLECHLGKWDKIALKSAPDEWWFCGHFDAAAAP